MAYLLSQTLYVEICLRCNGAFSWIYATLSAHRHSFGPIIEPVLEQRSISWICHRDVDLLFSFLFLSLSWQERKKWGRRAVVESKARRGRRTAVVPGCRWLREGQTNYPRLNTTMCHQLWPTRWQLLFHTPPPTFVRVPTACIGLHRPPVSTSRRVVMPRARWAKRPRSRAI